MSRQKDGFTPATRAWFALLLAVMSFIAGFVTAVAVSLGVR